MVPNLEIRGRTYIPIHEAARVSGLSAAYIGRLARTGVLTGQIIAGMWFLDRGQLRAFVVQRVKNGSTKP
jgi:hypothetical protein